MQYYNNNLYNNCNDPFDQELLECVMKGMGLKPSDDHLKNFEDAYNFARIDIDTLCGGENWTISFKTTKGVEAKIKVQSDLKVKELIKTYLEKYGLQPRDERLNKVQFLHNAKKLDKNSEKTLENIKLKDEACIVVYDCDGIIKETNI